MLCYTLWLGITKPYTEIFKEGGLLGFKDNIIYGDLLWAIEGSLDFIVDGKSEGNSDGNYEGVPADTYEGETLGPVYIKLLGVSDYYTVL